MVESNIEDFYISCDCHTEVLRVSFDKEIGIMYISYFQLGHGPNKRSIKDKLKHIWKILRTGTPWEDMICLNKDEVKKLRGFLDKIQNVKTNNSNKEKS